MPFAGNHAQRQRVWFMSLLHPLSYSSYRLQAPASQALGVFTSVVVIVSLGSLVVTVQAKVPIQIPSAVTFGF